MRISGVEIVYKGWLTLLVARLTDSTGQSFRREIEDHGQAAVVLPYDAERRTALLIRLPRAPVIHMGGPADLLEAPAGMIEDEGAAACARREALEEAGVRLDVLEPVAETFSMPGISTEVLHLFLAPYAAADRIAEGGGVEAEHENIQVAEMALGDLWGLVERGEIRDLKTLALVQALKIRRPDLFAPG